MAKRVHRKVHECTGKSVRQPTVGHRYRGTEKAARERRLTFIRKLMARGVTHTYDLVDICQRSDVFLSRTETKDRSGKVRIQHRLLNRNEVKRLIWETKRRMRDEVFDGEFELRQAKDRHVEAFRVARVNRDSRGMTLAQRELNRLLGLRVGSADANMSAETLMLQLREMQSMTMPGMPPSWRPSTHGHMPDDDTATD